MLGTRWRFVVVAELVSKIELSNWLHDIYQIYDELVPISKISIQNGTNSGRSSTSGESHSKSKGANFSRSHSNSSGTSNSYGQDSESSSESNSESNGENSSQSDQTSVSDTKSSGSSNSQSIEHVDKNVQELLRYIDEKLLQRVRLGFSRGMFKVTTYYMADFPSNAHRLKGRIISLLQGDSSTFSPLTAYEFDLSKSDARNSIKTFQNNSTSRGNVPSQRLTLESRPPWNRSTLVEYLSHCERSFIACRTSSKRSSWSFCG